MPVWSKVAIDYSKGLTKQPDGRLTPNKVGCMVMTVEEAIACRRK